MENNKDLKELFKELHEKYKTDDITISWEGGNDEGSYDLLIDGESIDHYESRESVEYQFVDSIASIIGYYSFAGDFFTNGEVSYNKETQCLVGDDSYEENAEKVLFLEEEDKITFKIPGYLWFDSIYLEASGHAEDIDVRFTFLITNGPVCEEHFELESLIKDHIKNAILKRIQEETSVGDVNSVYVDKEETRDSMKKDKDGNFILSIESIVYYQYETNDKTISIPIS